MTAELHRTPETTWTTEELASIRLGLASSIDRLHAELEMIDSLSSAASATTLEILRDDLDIASQRAEMLHDAVQAHNTAAILEQTQHVIGRLDAGLYGTCEGCSGTIGRPRLEAFPRATLCISCAH